MSHQLLITAKAPLLFSTRKPDGQFTPSLTYIPGGTLWGALGAQLGTVPTACFSHALPMQEGDNWVRVLPATAMSCKQHPGFRSDPPNEEREAPHGVFDTLLDRLCWEQLQPAALAYDPHCPACHGRATARSGVYAEWQGDADEAEPPKRWESRRVNHRILTRVAIERRRSTAADGLLYSPIVISENSRFMGWVEGLDEESHQKLSEIYALGARTSSGLGQVTLLIKKQREPRAPVPQRLIAFHQAFAKRWQLFCDYLAPQQSPSEWDPQTGRLFSVGLQSDALLQESGWLPTMIFSADQLRAQTGLEATLVRAQASRLLVGGWNVLWNRPKPTQVAVAAGSVFVFHSQAPEDTIVTALEKLEQAGIGQRCAEGYGRVFCCDPFHVDALGEAL